MLNEVCVNVILLEKLLILSVISLLCLNRTCQSWSRRRLISWCLIWMALKTSVSILIWLSVCYSYNSLSCQNRIYSRYESLIYHSSSRRFIKTLKYASIILMNVLHSKVWCQCHPGRFPGCVQGWCCREGRPPLPPHRRPRWQPRSHSPCPCTCSQ